MVIIGEAREQRHLRKKTYLFDRIAIICDNANMFLFCINLLLLVSLPALAQIELVFVDRADRQFTTLAHEVERRTSITLANKAVEQSWTQPWVWVSNLNFAQPRNLATWLKRGGMLIVETNNPEVISKNLFSVEVGIWQKTIPLDHQLMRSFYLLDSLPSCHGNKWQGMTIGGRLAIVYIPYHLSRFLQDKGQPLTCLKTTTREEQTRIFINLLMVALATDYKKDQVHLPEILKRLR